MARAPVPTAALVATLAAGAAVGCRSLGPETIARDRYAYSDSLSESWKRQTLLNIVKLRYLDPPIFVDVGQIVAGYSLETGVSIAGQAVGGGGDTATLGATGKFTDRPTITYTPLTGNHFVKALMTPLPPEAVFFTMQSGWPADSVMLAAVSSINGLKNQETSLAGATPPDARFLRVLALLRELQRSGAASFRVRVDAEKSKTSLLTFRAPDADPAAVERIRELRGLLRLDSEASEFALVLGGNASGDKELAVITRSLLHIMTTIAAQADVPAEDIAEGRATPGLTGPPDGDDAYALVRIHCSREKPADASVSVSYRRHWFWIDDRDLKSKRAFAFMLMLFTLSDTGEKEAPPLITIPAQ